MSVKTTWLLQRAPANLPASAREHVRLVTRLLFAQAGAAAAVSLLFSRRNTAVIVTTITLVAALCVLAVLAHTGTPSARTVVLGFEIALIVFGLYRFFFYRYVGGTVFAIVIAAALLHPSVIRAYGAMPSGEPSDVARGDGPGGRGVPGGPGLVLLIEHDAAVAELARRYLERDGLTVRVVGTLADAVAALRGGPPAVVVLDLTMPGLTPGGVRRRLPVRGHGGVTELICLAGPSGLRPRHVGIAGEGDRRCIARPFSPRVLVARVRAAMRQSPALTARGSAFVPVGTGCVPAGTYTLGELILDTEAQRASVAGADVCLTATEFALLAFLAGNAGRVFSRQQLLGAVRGAGATAGVRTVDVHVVQLRAKLGTHSPIRTVRGVGYIAEARTS